MPQYLFNDPDIASIRDHNRGGTVSCEDVHPTVFLDSCSVLVGHEHPVDVASIPSSAKVSVEEGMTSIDF